jgi:hypothetical protein
MAIIELLYSEGAGLAIEGAFGKSHQNDMAIKAKAIWPKV